MYTTKESWTKCDAYVLYVYILCVCMYTYLQGVKYKTVRGRTKGGRTRNKGWTPVSIHLYLSLYTCKYMYIYRLTDFGKDGADWTDGSRLGFKKAGGSGGPG